jgi:hypothetical protein
MDCLDIIGRELWKKLMQQRLERCSSIGARKRIGGKHEDD